MDEEYTVDLDELQSLAHRTDDFASHVRERILAAQAVATTLLTSWTGPAADAFELAHQDWVRSAENVVAEVTAMAASARHAHEVYSAAFEGNSSMLLQGRP